ncbi:MAG: hypothetical protein IKJ37_02240, partial [Kiritimatiellae bacterium]|nr:hypothetical protein [Kiritimatiellia bacterium]
GNLKTGAFCGELAGSASSNVITNSLCDIDRAVAGAYSAQNSTSTRYIVPVKHKSDAELEDEGYIVIHTAQEFIDAINDDMGGYYALGADIDFNGIDYTSLENNIDSFWGELNGNGYKIKNLTIDSSEEYVGLFGSADGAYIDNVIIENVNIKDDRYVDALVGKAFSTTITNCGVIGGTVEGNAAVGGLVGHIDSSDITTSYVELGLVKANVSDAGGFIGEAYYTDVSRSYSKTDVETDVRGGVFTACNNYSNIENSFAIGEVIGRTGVGGFSGRNVATTISKSYSSAKVTGTTSVGAFIGEFVGNNANNEVKDSFFDTDVSGVTDAIGTYSSADSTQAATLNGISTSRMTTPSMFAGAGWRTDAWYFVVAGKVVLNSVGSYYSATPDQCSTLMGYATAEMKEARVYEELDFDDEVWDIRDGAYPNLRHHFVDLFPELDPTATVADVKAVLESAVDPALANISDVATYNMFRLWANSVKVSSSAPASVLAVKESPNAWLSFALDTDALIAAAPKEGDLKIDGFTQGPSAGGFDLSVSISGITVGDGALEANIRKVFDIEGSEKLDMGDERWDMSNVEVSAAAPENGKVKFTVAPKMEGGEKPNSFFFRVKMK